MDRLQWYVMRYGIPFKVYAGKLTAYKSRAQPMTEEPLTMAKSRVSVLAGAG